MNMQVIGYTIAGIGIAILVFGAGGFGFSLPVDSWIVNVGGMVCVGLGVVLVIMEGGSGRRGKGTSGHYEGTRKTKHKGKVPDLPVYEGDNIIAYRRD